jgi:hypothetical protein
LSTVRRRLPFGGATRATAVLVAALPFAAALFAALPISALATPLYTVDSNLDYPKSGSSGPNCQSTAPGNPCTLRAAIETANLGGGGATIDVPGSLGTIQLDPNSGTLQVGVGLTVRATGAGSPRIDGGNATALLTSTSQDPVALSGLTFQNGHGGSVLNLGQQMTLDAVTVTGNHANHAVISTGALTSNGSRVTANFDGGMALTGATTLNNTEVSHNDSLGGIFSANAPLVLNGGSVSDNAQLAGDGGGLVAFNALTVTGTSFSRNGASGLGGALDVIGPASLTAVKVTGNTARAGGGGIVVDGTTGPVSATIASSTLSGNSSRGDGAGIAVLQGTLRMTGSTLDGNASALGAGGGIAAISSSVSLTDDTLTGNAALSLTGGGIAQEGFQIAHTRGQVRPSSPAPAVERELQSVRANLTAKRLPAAALPQAITGASAAPRAAPDDVTMQSVTLAGNSAASGGGISNGQGLAFTVRGSIVAANSASAGPTNCLGVLASGGHNLESSSDCLFRASGDLQSTDPELAPLAANGGPTKTMALNAGSPAIDAGDPTCPPPASDQRGVARPQGPRCDIGAYEGGSPLPAPPVTGRLPESQADWLRVMVVVGIVALMVLISATAAVRS